MGVATTVLNFGGYAPRHRVYPVGRLDRTTSGLILLTSDGRVVNSVLRGENKMPKVYDMAVDGTLRDDDLRRLRVSGGVRLWFPPRDQPPPPFLFLFLSEFAHPPPEGMRSQIIGCGIPAVVRTTSVVDKKRWVWVCECIGFYMITTSKRKAPCRISLPPAPPHPTPRPSAQRRNWHPYYSRE